MKVSYDGKPTFVPIEQLVEGEAFIHHDPNGNETTYIYAYSDEALECIALLQVTPNGLISRTYSDEFVLEWWCEPLEITSIAFAPSTVRNHC